jgi:hypothetical protein
MTLFLILNQSIKGHIMTIEKTFQGAWRISTMHNGYLVSHQFMGYTKKDAIQAFKQIIKGA